MKKLLVVLFCIMTGAGMQAFAQKGPMFKF